MNQIQLTLGCCIYRAKVSPPICRVGLGPIATAEIPDNCAAPTDVMKTPTDALGTLKSSVRLCETSNMA